MRIKKDAAAFSAAMLKWTVAALIAFLLAGLVTKKLRPDKRNTEREPFQRMVESSLTKLNSEDQAGAVEVLARAGKVASSDVAAQLSLIPKFTALGEHKLAAEAMERSIRGAPKEQQTIQRYTGLCEYLLEHDEVGNAKRILMGDLVARWPDAFETAYIQGVVTLKGESGKDELAAAAEQLQKCVAVDQNHVPSKLQLGIAYSRLSELDKSEPLLRAALEKRPFDPVVLYHLGQVLQQQGKTAEAAKCQEDYKHISELQNRRKQLEAQYSLNKYQPEDLLELSRIYSQLSEFARAVSTLRVYTKLKPADAEGQRQLARACLKIDDKEGARLATELADGLAAKGQP